MDTSNNPIFVPFCAPVYPQLLVRSVPLHGSLLSLPILKAHTPMVAKKDPPFALTLTYTLFL